MGLLVFPPSGALVIAPIGMTTDRWSQFTIHEPCDAQASLG